MEQLNRVTLRGYIGSVRVQELTNSKVVNATIATNYAFKDRSGCACIETTWTNLTIFGNDKGADPSLLKKGMPVEVTGRLRNQRFTAQDGTERYSTDVLVSKLAILDVPTLSLSV